MKQHSWYFHLCACALGAINGLLIGVATYAVLWLSVEHKNQLLFEEQLSGSSVMHISVGIKWYVLPIISMVTFTVASLLVHRYLAHRVKSIVLLWEYVGGVSLLFGTLAMLTIILIDQFFGAAPIDFKDLISMELLLNCFAIFVLVSSVNLIYGIFIKTAVKQYSQNKPQPYK
jgi:drug/metabolite transporter (DMT)-like permease